MSKTKCFDIDSLSRYSVGQGSEKWRRAVAEHIRVCTVCKRELSALDGVVDALGRSPKCDPPDQWGSIAARLEPRRVGWLAPPVFLRARVVVTLAVLLVAVVAGVRIGEAPAPRQSTAKLQSIAAEDQPAELARSHMALAWNDPFADSASLAVMASRQKASQTR